MRCNWSRRLFLQNVQKQRNILLKTFRRRTYEYYNTRLPDRTNVEMSLISFVIRHNLNMVANAVTRTIINDKNNNVCTCWSYNIILNNICVMCGCACRWGVLEWYNKIYLCILTIGDNMTPPVVNDIEHNIHILVFSIPPFVFRPAL